MEEITKLFDEVDSTGDTISEKFRQLKVHEIYKSRLTHGEYHHLFPLLKKYPDKFHQYLRMTYSTFYYILAEIKPLLLKNWCNLHDAPIKEEEQLVITLRLVSP